MNIQPKIIVIGSANADLTIRTNYFPAVGETVLGNNFLINTGGKGANQAVAAARLGANVSFVGAIGNDVFGDLIKDNLHKNNINLDNLFKIENVASGTAVIIVNEEGENEIVVAPGANYQLSNNHIEFAVATIAGADIILMQHEIQPDTVLHVIRKAKALGKNVQLNPSPATLLPEEIFENLFLILLNEKETEQITGISTKTDKDIEVAAQWLKNKGVQNIVITLGKKGAYIFNGAINEFISSIQVKVVDSTAAGDTFAGALAVALTQNKNLKQAVLFATKAAAISVTRAGAQMSMPYLNEII